MTIFDFKIAKVDEEKLDEALKADSPRPGTEFRTIYVIDETEEKATEKVNSYVSKTKYADIEDKKLIR